MKLLPRKELKSAVQGQTDNEFVRTSELVSAIALMERKLNTLKNDYAKESIDMRERLTNEMATLEEERNTLFVEVSSLEKRKEEALKPVKKILLSAKQKEQKAKEMVDEALERKEQMDIQEEDIQERILLVTQKMDYVTELEERAEKDGEKAKSLKQSSELLYRTVQESADTIQETFAKERTELQELSKQISKERAEISVQREHLDVMRLQISKEQEKVDKDRQILGATIKTLKNRGLWHKQNEMTIE